MEQSMPAEQLDFFDLRTLFRVCWRSKWLIGGSALATGILFFCLTFLMTPYYRVTAVVADASEQMGNGALMGALGQLGSLASLAGLGLGGEVRASDEATAVLGSDEFLQEFIDKRNLMPVFYADKWDPVAKTWKVSKSDQPTYGRAIRFLRDNIVVTRERRTGLISISVDWKDPKVAAQWCRELIDELNAEMQRRALRRSREHIQFLRKQLDVEVTLETRQAVGRLLEAQLKQEMLASVSKDFVFKVVSINRPPELDRKVRPRRGLFAALGLLFGMGAGVIAAYWRLEKRRQTV
jgi:uncharacterized protein involved in exopolysaccharide biosynthesis